MRVQGAKKNKKLTAVAIATTNTEKKNIHNVFIVDASGSMDQNNKYDIAISSLNELLSDIKSDPDTNNTVMIVEFEGKRIETRIPFGSSVPSEYRGMGTGGMTPLNQAIGETLESVLKLRANSDDKVLVNIFTDGGENQSRNNGSKYANNNLLSSFIKQCEIKGFTITFIGTQNEVDYAVNMLSMDMTNTMVHDNTASSVKASLDVTRSARMMYSKSVSKGENVTKSFYTKTVSKK